MPSHTRREDDPHVQDTLRGTQINQERKVMSIEQRKNHNEDEIDRKLRDLIGRIEGEVVSDEILELAAKLQQALMQRRDPSDS
jgi:hypothetical protein